MNCPQFSPFLLPELHQGYDQSIEMILLIRFAFMSYKAPAPVVEKDSFAKTNIW